MIIPQSQYLDCPPQVHGICVASNQLAFRFVLVEFCSIPIRIDKSVIPLQSCFKNSVIITFLGKLNNKSDASMYLHNLIIA